MKISGLTFKSLLAALLLFTVFLLSPIYVDWFWDYFTIDGWMAIGYYNNDFVDGFYRSFIYSLYFIPIFYLISKLSFKIFSNSNIFIKIRNSSFNFYLIFIFLIFLYIVAYKFKLGITGIETQTEFKLSGIMHYFRSYIAPIVVVYYLMTKKPSLTIITLYAFIAGFTAGSRFVIIIPFMLFFIFTYLNKTIAFNYLRVFSIALLILGFIFITMSRNYLYSETPRIEDFIMTFDVLLQALNQVFLKLGIGRDVILSYEVLQTGVCSDSLSFILTGNSCTNPPLDFYGLNLSDTKFYLAAPTFPNLFILESSFSKIAVYFLFMFQIYLSASSFIILRKYGKIFILYGIIGWLLSLVFIIIGPLLFLNYIIVFNLGLLILLRIVLKR